MKEADDPRAMARNLLHSAHERAVLRVNRNYKTAIPHYYQGAIQLLLPLCLVSASKAELALTVTRHGNQYRGGTVLTLTWRITTLGSSRSPILSGCSPK